MSKKQIILLVLAALLGVPLLGMIDSRLAANRSPNLADLSDQVVPGRAATMPFVKQVGNSMAQSEIMPMPPMDETNGGFTAGVERTVIKTASMTLLVNDTRQAVDRISAATTELAGTVTSSNIYESEFNPGVVQATLVLRVPVDQLTQALAKLRSLAEKVTAETINADDRTEQKVDLDAQLKNVRASEEQLLTIMRQAKNVEETLEVQRELSNTRNQIERLQAQLDNLVGDAAMSTITVSLSTKESERPIVEANRLSIWEEVRAVVRNVINLYRSLFIAGLRIAILALPVLLIASLVWLFWHRRNR